MDAAGVNETIETVETVREERSFAAPAGAPGVTYFSFTARPRDPSRERARLAIVHGYGDHAGRYEEFMTWLAARGVGCHAFDLRGHGRSSGRRGFVDRWDEYLDDLDAFLGGDELHARPSSGAQPPPPAVFVLGHSHGGLVVSAAAVRHRLEPHHVRGVILSAPYLVNAHPIPGHKLLAARVANRLCPWLRIRSGIRPEMMTSDVERVHDSRDDALLLRTATPRWFMTHRPTQSDVLARAGEMTLPLLVLQGDADPIADPAGARRFHDAARSPDKTLITYPGFKHEPLREAGRERVFADILHWMVRRSDAIPSPATPGMG
jgi:alpha-beta hydrolase superfamily lysophospholipase